MSRLQSLHNYTLYTYVYVHHPMLTRTRLLPVALLCPLLTVVPTTAFSSANYTTTSTCWLNFTTINATIEMVPNIACACLAVIISEATPMRKYKPHINV